MNRIPSLDGWRGIAITLVLLDHLQDSLLGGGHLSHSTETGYHGVVLFFVLSGFLITSKLLEGPMNFRRFYLRRFFRLMPAAWTFLAFLVFVGLLTGKQFTSRAELLGCVFFYRNFLGKMGFAGHFWSLSIEEQFYLVWPLTLFLAGAKRARWIALFGALGCAIFRWVAWPRYGPQFPTGPTFLHADWLLMGCFAALLMYDQSIRRVLAQISRPWPIPALCIFIFCMLSQGDAIAEAFSLAALLVSTTLHPTTAVARAVSFKPLAWLGRVSYSVYLWQGFFFAQHQIWALCVTPLFALASYYCIERPLTRFGHRLTRENPSQTSRTPVSSAGVIAE